jgi:hypothetical protein
MLKFRYAATIDITREHGGGDIALGCERSAPLHWRIAR